VLRIVFGPDVPRPRRVVAHLAPPDTALHLSEMVAAMTIVRAAIQGKIVAARFDGKKALDSDVYGIITAQART